MSFLKSLGQALNVASAFVPATAPLINLAIPKAAPVVGDVQSITGMLTTIINIEQMGQQLSLTGDQKVKLAAPQIAQLLASSPLLMGRKVKDAAKYQQDVTDLAGKLADILNDFEEIKTA